jgi:hypothetical protein
VILSSGGGSSARSLPLQDMMLKNQLVLQSLFSIYTTVSRGCIALTWLDVMLVMLSMPIKKAKNFQMINNNKALI